MMFLQDARFFLVLYILISTNSINSCVQGKCLNDQRALLLQLNQSLTSSDSFSPKRSSWQLNTDCCSSWDGISCNRDGNVIGLDLSQEYASVSVQDDFYSGIFKLQYLERLNLAENSFFESFPSGFDQLLNLEYLNLSNSGFHGEIPIGISRLTRLVVLDLSITVVLGFTDPGPVHYIMESKITLLDLENFTRNLTELRELHLSGVDLSEHGNEWCRIFSSYLPKLQVLNLVYCGISGPFHSSLQNLRSLSILNLNYNNISAQVPDFFSKFSNLTSLQLRDCKLYGRFPKRVLQLQTLQRLDLRKNDRLEGSLPDFPENGLLQELMLSFTRFSGELPNSIGNLRLLSTLYLQNCAFNGSIPSSFSKLNQLQYIDLSNNSFTGLITSISWSDNLEVIHLSHNRLTGPIPCEWNKLLKLTHLLLMNNLLNGTMTAGLFTLPSLQYMDISMNRFSGQLGEFSNGSHSKLQTIDLSNNQLEGLIPKWMFEIRNLDYLILSSNNFSGTAHPNSVTNLGTIYISGNQLTEIPTFLEHRRSHLLELDLSRNQIHGKIPNWIWKMKSLHKLNLSQNFLEDPDNQWPVNSFKSMKILDLHSNRLRGKNPILPSSVFSLDYSFNNFTTMIPNIYSYSEIMYFLFSNNQLNGGIPAWMCDAVAQFSFLDLSFNNLSGEIPSCLLSNPSLQILNLKGNNFHGNISLFPDSCKLRTLDLSRNNLEGYLPRSIVSCTGLEVFDVANNQLTGDFPSWIMSIPRLRVLVLRSNKFSGAWGSQGTGCNFTMLQIFDISSNNFSGTLPKECFLSWNAMMVNTEEKEWNHQDQVIEFSPRLRGGKYYQQTVTVTVKGIHTDLVKILTIFTFIDLSNNNFEGEIPTSIGNLTSLYGLNFSSNALTGTIPLTFGNLKHLESLDLSRNKMTGEIPFQLAGLSSLSVLNVSFNKLTGKIPSGGQFQTFQSSSFQGNVGLCGFPLSKDCNATTESPPNGLNSVEEKSKNGFDWVLFGVTFLGFVVGACMVIGPQYFWKKGRQWANERINKLLNIG